MDRRKFLKRAGAAGGIVGGAALFGGLWHRNREESGAGARPTPEPTRQREERVVTPTESSRRFADQYDTVVDAVAAGADPEGNEPINGMLEEYADDDTLLSFPAGSYRIRPMKLAGYSGLGIAGAYRDRPTFFADPGSFSGSGRFLVFDDVSAFRLDGIDFDFCRGGNGGNLMLRASGDATVSNVDVAASCSSHLSVLGLMVRDPDSVGHVENFTINEGDSERLTAVYVHPEHSGSLTFRDCEIWGFSDNGLYASAPGLPDGEGGTVHVEGGSYGNNNVASIRLGTQGSTVRDVSVRVDDSPGFDPVNARGIRLRNEHGQLIENAELVYTADASYAFGAIVFHSENSGATVRGTEITVDRDGVAGVFSLPNETDRPSSLLFEDVTINGDANSGYAADLSGRDDVVFRNCTIEGTGEKRHGIRIADGENCRIVDSHIDVRGTPVVAEGGTATLQNTTVATPDGSVLVDEQTVGDDTFDPDSGPKAGNATT